MKIILDCYGGDNSPFAQVEGAVNAINKNSELSVVLVGKSNEINAELEKYEFDESRIEVLNADDVITCEDKPTSAIKEKPNSSLSVAFDLLKNDDECTAMISSGSSGAILAGSVMKIGRIKGISRPALAPFLPTKGDGRVMVLDCGANADCKPINLLHFALMGSIYYRQILGRNKPRVAVLSNGTEAEKGSELTKQAYELIKDLKDIEFCGNIEARDIVSAKYDVIVCDGFSGNIALKSLEGAVQFFMSSLKTEIKKSFIAKIGALLMKKQFHNLKKKLDYNAFGGAVVIGANSIVIKAHGAASPVAVEAALLQALAASKADLVGKIKNGLGELEIKSDD